MYCFQGANELQPFCSIEYLISKGARVNAIEIYGQTPLHLAAMRGNLAGCKSLLSAEGVNIEVSSFTLSVFSHMISF